MRFFAKPALVGSLLLTGSILGPSITAGPVLAAAKPTGKLQAVASQTAAAKTLTFGVNMAFTMNLAGKTISGSMLGTGQSDRTNKASSFTLDMGDFMKSAAASSGKALPPQFSDPSQFKMSIVSIGSKMWMSYPLLNSAMGGAAAKTKPWVLIEAAQLGIDAGDLAASQGADPTQGLDLLAGLSESAKEVGTETIDGAKTIKYQGAITTAALTKNLPKAQSADVVKMMGSDSSIPVTVWIDEAGRARKFDMSFRLNQQGMNMTMKATYTFSKFNEPVSINPPPASQVGDNPMLTNALVQAAKAKKQAS